ncbi:MAG: helix-turn-helix domain-containing protein [SAR202 cluster bacterium]|nr:helix-turn-helix domain-containing protein [SAR202 cluster bacterium]
MAKQGKRTPKAIQDFVIAAKANAPGLTYSQIADRVTEKYGQAASIDRTTVGRILARARSRQSGGPGPGEGTAFGQAPPADDPNSFWWVDDQGVHSDTGLRLPRMWGTGPYGPGPVDRGAGDERQEGDAAKGAGVTITMNSATGSTGT